MSEEIDYSKLAHEARTDWLKTHCYNGTYPDTSFFDYCLAPEEAKTRGVSVEQVLYEFYRKREKVEQPITDFCTFPYNGPYLVRNVWDILRKPNETL